MLNKPMKMFNTQMFIKGGQNHNVCTLNKVKMRLDVINNVAAATKVTSALN
jgi:hypothetical protein